MLVDEDIIKNAESMAVKLKESGDKEIEIPDSPFLLVSSHSLKENDLPIHHVEGFIVVQRGI